jgi:hypothetical protein
VEEHAAPTVGLQIGKGPPAWESGMRRRKGKQRLIRQRPEAILWMSCGGKRCSREVRGGSALQGVVGGGGFEARRVEKWAAQHGVEGMMP